MPYIRHLTAPLLLLLLFSMLLGGCSSKYKPMDPASSPAPKPGAFILGPGDSIKITVWREDDLTAEYVLDPTGRITLPIGGEIHAAGKTVNELNKDVTKKLAEFYNNPQVAINVQAVGSRRIHVLGFVSNPGTQEFNRDVNLWDALAAAGGFNEQAEERYVLVMRNVDGKVQVRKVDTVIPEEDTSGANVGYVWLQPNDVVYALPSDAYKLEEIVNVINNIVSPLLSISQGIILYPDVLNILKDGKRMDDGGGGGSIVIAP